MSRPWAANSPRSAPRTAPFMLPCRPAKFAFRGRRGPLQKAFHIHPDQRRRDEAEAGEGRIAPADLRVVEEGVAETVLPGEIRQRASGIGDRDEMAPRLFAPSFSATRLIKIPHEGEGLHRPARFRGDDEERPAQIEPSARPRTAPGSVLSRTARSRKPSAVPKTFRKTSGARLEPPIPSRRAKLKPSARTPSTTLQSRRAGPASPAGCRASRGGLRSPQVRASRRCGPSAGSVPRPARPQRPAGLLRRRPAVCRPDRRFLNRHGRLFPLEPIWGVE